MHVEVAEVFAEGVHEEGVEVSVPVVVYRALELVQELAEGALLSEGPLQLVSGWLGFPPDGFSHPLEEFSDGSLDSGGQDHDAFVEPVPCEVFDAGGYSFGGAGVDEWRGEVGVEFGFGGVPVSGQDTVKGIGGDVAANADRVSFVG